jgi:predicted murein hydrolase (TIGR00659 family)
MGRLFHLWVYLETTPLLGLTATLVAWQVAVLATRRWRGSPLGNPVPVAILMLAVGLLATRTPYAAYFQGAQYVHFLLGPATVALAVPMYANLGRIRAAAPALVPALLAGSATAAVSAMLMARWLGATPEIVLSLAPKSVTTPIAMAVSQEIGGNASLTAIFVILTGLVAAVLLEPAMRLVGVRDARAVGLAAGTAGHGIGTAQALQIGETEGAFAGLAIGLNGVVTALLLPLLARFL